MTNYYITKLHTIKFNFCAVEFYVRYDALKVGFQECISMKIL